MRPGFLGVLVDDSVCSVCMLLCSVVVVIMLVPPETGQQIGSRNIVSSQTRCAGLGIRSRPHTAELCADRRIMPLRSGPVLHQP